MRRIHAILLLLLLSLPGWADLVVNVPCGSDITVTATPLNGYQFAGWSDGVDDATRTIEVRADVVLWAYFETTCAIDYELPVVARYDWLLMLNAKEVRAQGYIVEEHLVKWYRVVGEPDIVSDPNYLCDDEYMVTGLYLTIDQNLSGTGDYYCILQGPVDNNGYCTGILRSQIVHYTSPLAPDRSITLDHTLGNPGDRIVINGLDPDKDAYIRIYSVTGKLLGYYHSIHESQVTLDCNIGIQGCYEICVEQNKELTVLRYMVR